MASAPYFDRSWNLYMYYFHDEIRDVYCVPFKTYIVSMLSNSRSSEGYESPYRLNPLIVKMVKLTVGSETLIPLKKEDIGQFQIQIIQESDVPSMVRPFELPVLAADQERLFIVDFIDVLKKLMQIWNTPVRKQLHEILRGCQTVRRGSPTWLSSPKLEEFLSIFNASIGEISVQSILDKENEAPRQRTAREAHQINLEEKHNDIRIILTKLSRVEIEPYVIHHYDVPYELNWDEVPEDVKPVDPDNPGPWLDKQRQLSDVIRFVHNIISDDGVVVDFCAGDGHLGLLIAHLFPMCQVLMVESDAGAADRTSRRLYKFPNARMFHSTVEGFHGHFDMAVALGACGSAADHMISKAVAIGAAFVITTCCYGFIKAGPSLSYPRSPRFASSGITLEEYYLLSYIAQVSDCHLHKVDKAKRCKGLVDADRIMFAEHFGYKCRLFNMQPVHTNACRCSLLLGVPENMAKESRYSWILSRNIPPTSSTSPSTSSSDSMATPSTSSSTAEPKPDEPMDTPSTSSSTTEPEPKPDEPMDTQ